MNSFELFSLAPAPTLDQGKLKEEYLRQAERWHPDRIQGSPQEKEKAGEVLAEWNRAYETLSSNRLRLGLLFQILTGEAHSKTGRVTGKEADLLMKVGSVCRKTDLALDRRKQASGAIEIAMLGGEIMEATQAVSAARSEIEEWDEELERELEQLRADWDEGRRDPSRVEKLHQFFSYADKARRQLEEKFLKLAECL